MMDLSFDFPKSYEISFSRDPSWFADRVHTFAGVTDLFDVEPLTIRVIPDGKHPWTGSFIPGSEISSAVSGVFTYPSERYMLVVSGGQAFRVNVHDPAEWEAIQTIFPVMGIYPVRERDMILLTDATRVAAYGRRGLTWKTSDLSYDGINITGISSRAIHGLGWSAPDGTEVEFVIDLDTGSSEGGASPEKDLTPF